MIGPPPYSRTPYLWRDDGIDSNLVADSDREEWLAVPVRVEEKLDGANVSLWLDAGRIQVASRGGPDAMDRAGQLGRLRSWAAEHYEQLMVVLEGGRAAYGEWLWLEHTVAYDRLPDWLMILDLWTPDEGLLSCDIRDRVVAEAELFAPPLLFTGVLRDRESLVDLMGRSRCGTRLMEGVVLRRGDGARCKVVRTGFDRKPDSAWATQMRTNRLRSPDR